MSDTSYYSFIKEGPVGPLKIIASEEAITHILFDETGKTDNPSSLTLEAAKQLLEYFEGKRTSFDLPLAPEGTAFQKSVWQALQQIPYGRTISYMALSNQIENPKAIRAVGRANGQNPIPIVIPCHRVIGSNGQLVGYGGGLWRKKVLLKLEGLLPQEELKF